MDELTSVVALTIDGQTFSLQDMLYRLKLSGQLDFVDKAIESIVIDRAVAADDTILVTDEELQEAADEMRKELDLHSAEDTREWLEEQNMTLDDFEKQIESELLSEKLKEKIAGESQVEQFFAVNRREYDRADLAHIVVSSEGLAQELLMQLEEESADFGKLASQYSVDEDSKEVGGELGKCPRNTLSPSVESAVFTAKLGDVVGPIKTDMGFHVIKVNRIDLGEIDEDIENAIEETLFREWLEEKLAATDIQVPLLDII